MSARPLSWMVLMTALLGATALAQDMPPELRKRSARSIFMNEAKKAFEQKKLEGSDGAIALFNYVVTKAASEQGDPKETKELVASSLYLQALCYEAQESVDPDQAIQNARPNYDKISNEYGDVAPTDPSFVQDVVTKAKKKIEWRGVDVYYQRLHPQLKALVDRVHGAPNRDDLAPVRDAAWNKIKPMDKEAIQGLLNMLAYNQDRILSRYIREFAAEALAEVGDETALAAVIPLINTLPPELRDGASSAMGFIMRKYDAASQHDRRAQAHEQHLAKFIPKTEELKKTVAGIQKQIQEERDHAAQIRHNLPPPTTENFQSILKGLEEVLKAPSDPNAIVQCGDLLEKIGRVNPDIQAPDSMNDLLIGLLNAPYEDVRAQIARSLGALRTKKAVPNLQKVVEYEPQLDESPQQDVMNTEKVRQATAKSLAMIGDVRAIPSLIEALDDRDLNVRRESYLSLKQISQRELRTGDEPYKPDDDYRKRKAFIEAWNGWWKEEEGIVVLIERFIEFERGWHDYGPSELFKLDRFQREREKEYRSLKSDLEDLAAIRDAGLRAFKAFQTRKDFCKKEILDIGPSAYLHLKKFLGGRAPDRLRKPLDKPQGDPNKADAALRYFVAETMADMIKTFDLKDELATIRTMASSGDRDNRIGAIAVLRNLPVDLLKDSDFEILEKATADEYEISSEASDALAQHKHATSLTNLIQAIGNTDHRIQVEALFSLKTLLESKALPKLDDSDAVKALAKNIFESTKYEVRQASAEVLGWVAMPDRELRTKYWDKIRAQRRSDKKAQEETDKAWTDFVKEHATAGKDVERMVDAYWALARARADEDQDVQRAASQALKQIGKDIPDAAGHVVALFISAPDDEMKKNPYVQKDSGLLNTLRRGGVLSVTDIGPNDRAAIDALRYDLVSHSQGLDPYKRDPSIRKAAAEAMGQLKVKRYDVLQDLVRSLVDPVDLVRETSYKSLKQILEMEPYGTNKAPTIKKKDGTEYEYDPSGISPDERRIDERSLRGGHKEPGKEAFRDAWLKWLKLHASDFE